MSHVSKKPVVLGVSMVILAATLLLALPRDMVEVQYFNDPDMTDYTGMQILVRCNGSQGPLWGEVAEYSIETRSDCREQNVISTCYRNHWREYPDGHRELEMRTEVACPGA